MLNRNFKLIASLGLATFMLIAIVYSGTLSRLRIDKSRDLSQQEARQHSKEARIQTDLQDDFIELAQTKEDSFEHFLGEIDKGLRPLCPIFTFIKSKSDANQAKIRLWTRSWYRHGFQPYVLTEKDALSRPEFGSLVGKIPSLEYHSGYMRWLALSSVQGGAYADLDVLPLHGPVEIFAEYKSDNCRFPDDLTITEEIKFNLFLFDQDTVKGIVKKLVSEQYLKGHDSVWLMLHAKEYRIKKTQDKLPAIDLTQTVYVQKHRRWAKGISAEALKLVLARANFMNSRKVFFVDSEDTSRASPIKTALQKTLICPDTAMAFDKERILPNLPFKCQVKSIEGLAKIDLTSEQRVENLYIVFLHKVRNESKMLSRIFPGLSRDNREGHMKLLQSLIRSRQVLFVPVDCDYGKLVTFLEFNLGLTLDPVPEHETTLKESETDLKLEKELYDLVLNYFTIEVAKLIEFDFE